MESHEAVPDGRVPVLHVMHVTGVPLSFGAGGWYEDAWRDCHGSSSDSFSSGNDDFFEGQFLNGEIIPLPSMRETRRSRRASARSIESGRLELRSLGTSNAKTGNKLTPGQPNGRLSTSCRLSYEGKDHDDVLVSFKTNAKSCHLCSQDATGFASDWRTPHGVNPCDASRGYIQDVCEIRDTEMKNPDYRKQDPFTFGLASKRFMTIQCTNGNRDSMNVESYCSSRDASTASGHSNGDYSLEDNDDDDIESGGDVPSKDGQLIESCTRWIPLERGAPQQYIGSHRVGTDCAQRMWQDVPPAAEALHGKLLISL